ncbi:hypothetical protein GF337_01880 [candidate division KSB1 bacterium]|nr:hypothetical protein [candidate division KSB1 bacterium]
MKKLIMLICGVTFLANCNSEELKNQWASGALYIDGRSDDWDGYDLHYFEDQDAMLGTLNDSENIYLMMRFSNRRLAHKIHRHGITIWLDKQGEKEKSRGFQYTGSMEIQQEIDRLHEQFKQKMPQRNDGIQRLTARMEPDVPDAGRIWIIEGDDRREVGDNQTHGTAAGSKIVDGVYCYEFRMPIPTGLESKKKINLCVELGGLSEDDLKEIAQQRFNPDGGMGRHPGGMGRRPGGIRGGPGGIRGNRGQRPDAGFVKEQDIWLKLILAEKPE